MTRHAHCIAALYFSSLSPGWLFLSLLLCLPARKILGPCGFIFRSRQYIPSSALGCHSSFLRFSLAHSPSSSRREGLDAISSSRLRLRFFTRCKYGFSCPSLTVAYVYHAHNSTYVIAWEKCHLTESGGLSVNEGYSVRIYIRKSKRCFYHSSPTH